MKLRLAIRLLLAATIVVCGLTQAPAQDDEVDEDKPDYGELVDLAETRPEFTNLFDLEGDRDADLFGAWSVAARWPIVAIHAALLPNGDVLTYGTNEWADNGTGFVYDRWRPELGLSPDSHVTLDVETSNNLFCSAQALVPGTGGLMLVTGGSVEKNGKRNYGSKAVNVFDPIDNTFFKPLEPMKKARWYPTVTQLADGRILIHGGRGAKKTPTTIPELFDPVSGNWKLLTSAASEEVYSGSGWNYPRSFLAPNGEALVLPPGSNDMFFLDPAGRGSFRKIGTLPVKPSAGNHLAVMFERNQILCIRNLDARVLNLSGDEVNVVDVPDIATKRAWADATLLANGEVLVNGGASVNQSLADAVKYTEIWNPQTGEWRIGATAQKSRLYHSTSLLLPNGTVLCAGGGPPGPTANLNAEVYYPPYLFTRTGNWRKRPRLLGVVDDGGSVIQIRAAGDEGTEQFELHINGKPVETFSVSTEFETYTHTTVKPVTGDQVRIVFINDEYAEGFDSNLTVDYIKIDGLTHETEHPRVFSMEEGVPGYPERETLYQNGYVEYWDQPNGHLQLGSLPYGGVVDILIDRARTIEKVMLIRFGSVTHSFDMGQRGLSVDFSQSNGSLMVSIPSIRKECPPGYYMLFAINDVGTPSEAAILELE